MIKTVKAISIILIILMLISTINYATFTPNSITPNPNIDTANAVEATKIILQYIRTFGVIVSVIVLMVLGLKYITGSLEERAEYKKSMMPFVIGVVVIFSATQIVSFIYTALNP